MTTAACKWCETFVSLDDLIGPHTNLCPRCGNPALAARFADVGPGRTFICSQGGAWRKIDGKSAACIESDSGFQPGTRATFFPDDVTYPH